MSSCPGACFLYDCPPGQHFSGSRFPASRSTFCRPPEAIGLCPSHWLASRDDCARKTLHGQGAFGLQPRPPRVRGCVLHDFGCRHPVHLCPGPKHLVLRFTGLHHGGVHPGHGRRVLLAHASRPASRCGCHGLCLCLYHDLLAPQSEACLRGLASFWGRTRRRPDSFSIRSRLPCSNLQFELHLPVYCRWVGDGVFGPGRQRLPLPLTSRKWKKTLLPLCGALSGSQPSGVDCDPDRHQAAAARVPSSLLERSSTR